VERLVRRVLASEQRIEHQGLGALVAWAAAVGVADALVAGLLINPHTAGFKADEVAAGTVAVNLYVAWVFFSGWFLLRADEEWKRVDEAVIRGDRATFLVEAPKRMPVSIRALYLLICILAVLSAHLFHFESWAVLIAAQFGGTFLVALTVQVLWDLDNPLSGVVRVPDIPSDWLEAVAGRA
jgi:hypothetical protein